MDQAIDQGIGGEIKRLRSERDWSMAKLAVEADMSVSGVSMIENGKRNLTTTTLAKLARAFGVEVADLFPKAEAQLPLDYQENGGATGPQYDSGYPTVAEMLIDAMFERARSAESGTAQEHYLHYERDLMDRLLRLPKAEVAQACIDLARGYLCIATPAAAPIQDSSKADEALDSHEYAELVAQVAQKAADRGVAVDIRSYTKHSLGIPQVKITSGRKVGSTTTPRRTTGKKRAKKQ